MFVFGLYQAGQMYISRSAIVPVILLSSSIGLLISVSVNTRIYRINGNYKLINQIEVNLLNG